MIKKKLVYHCIFLPAIEMVVGREEIWSCSHLPSTNISISISVIHSTLNTIEEKMK